MDRLEKRIRQAVSDGRWVFTDHAEEQLAHRHVEGWQVVAGVADGETLESHPKAKPNPKVLIRQSLADGAMIIAVWGYVKSIRSAALITVYFELP